MSKKNTVQTINQILKDVFNFITSHPEIYVSNPGTDFSRQSALNLETTFLIPYSFNSRSIANMRIPWMTHFDFSVVPSAITAARKKIKSIAYVDALHRFNHLSRQQLTFKGLGLYAVDGSEEPVYGCANPRKKSDEPDPYLAKGKNGHTRRFFHINALYDCLENTYMDFDLQPGRQKNEDQGLLKLVGKMVIPDYSAIICADRGYENQMSFYRIGQMKQFYVIRLRDTASSKNIAKDLDLPDGEFDVPVHLLLCSHHRFRLMKLNGEKRTPKYIVRHAEYEEFEQQSELPLDVRLVRFCIIDENGKESWFMVATNLPYDRYTTEDIKEIYHRRWAIETSFNLLKHDVDLADLHSRRPDLIEQEVYAAATVYNACSRIRNELEKKPDVTKTIKKEKKSHNQTAQTRKLSFSHIVHCMKDLFFPTDDVTTHHLERMILQTTYQYKPNRPDTRKKSP